MKKIQTLVAAAFVALMGASMAYAQTPSSIEIGSFNYIQGAGSLLSELCGRVKDPVAASTLVRIVVDYNGRNPGVYTATAGKDGRFCVVMVSYRGTAHLSIDGQDDVAPVAASLTSPR